MKGKLPPIAKHFAIYMADQSEIQKAMKEKRLPEKLTPIKPPYPFTKKQEYDVALAYLLSDVVYQIMFDLTKDFLLSSGDLRHKSKHRFNEFFKAAQLFKDKASVLSKDIDDLQNRDSIFEDYFEDSSWLRETIELLFNRAIVSEDNRNRIKALLFNLPEKNYNE